MSTPARRTATDFGLTSRALAFARFYGENPHWGVTLCARQAGYSDRGNAAHVRGCELLRDPRVVRAVVHFGGLALNEVRGAAAARLRAIGDKSGWMSLAEHRLVIGLIVDLDDLKARSDRMDRLYAASVPPAA